MTLSLTPKQLLALDPCDPDSRLALFGKRRKLTTKQALEAGATIRDLLWVAGRLGRKDLCVAFALRCAQRVVHLTTDPRAQAALDATSAWLADPSEINRQRARGAANAAYANAYATNAATNAAAYATNAAADANAYATNAAADAAAYAAANAANAANADAYAVADATNAATNAAADANAYATNAAAYAAAYAANAAADANAYATNAAADAANAAYANAYATNAATNAAAYATNAAADATKRKEEGAAQRVIFLEIFG